MVCSIPMLMQPLGLLDEVNYSDFMDSVKRGDVEMVRVQAFTQQVGAS